MKLSGREKRIVQMMALVVGIALLTEGWDRYAAAKQSLANEVDRKSDDILSFMEQLQDQDITFYQGQVETLDRQLEDARQRIIALPNESEASLVVRKAVSDAGEREGVDVNSINVRKSKDLNPENGLREMRTYFGYGSELEELLYFFTSLSQRPYYMSIESVTIAARRQPRRRANARRPNNENANRRSTLNGNAIFVSLYQPDEAGRLEDYDSSSETSLRPERADEPEIPLDESFPEPLMEEEGDVEAMAAEIEVDPNTGVGAQTVPMFRRPPSNVDGEGDRPSFMQPRAKPKNVPVGQGDEEDDTVRSPVPTGAGQVKPRVQLPKSQPATRPKPRTANQLESKGKPLSGAPRKQ